MKTPAEIRLSSILQFPVSMLAMVALLIACSGNSVVTSSWKDPQALVQTDSLNKVMVGVLSFSEHTRRKAEERISLYHPSFTPSYQVLISKEILLDTARSKAILNRQNFDGAVIFWLVDKEQKTTYVEGAVHTNYYYWDYHYQYWANYHDPGYYQTDVTYLIETIVYSFERDELIWTAHTAIENPRDLNEGIDQVLDSIMDKMNDDGLFDAPLQLSR